MIARTTLVLLALTAVTACRGSAPSPSAEPARPAIATPADVLERMVTAHASAPTTATFTQTNTVTLASGDVTQRQRVIVEAPDRMRADNLPLSAQTGAIYAGGRALSFANGRRVAAANERNPHLLLGFGVYRQPAAATLAALRALGISTTVMQEGTYGGSPVWVIGAAPGDSTTNQVWIDATRWVPVRLIQSERRGTQTVVSDTRYSGHAAPAPTVPRAMAVYRNGRLALRAAVGELRTGVVVPAAAFDTSALRPVSF